MARYFIDCEFDGFGGPLMTMALIRDDGASIHAQIEGVEASDPWVIANVVPIINACPCPPVVMSREGAGRLIAQFLNGDPDPLIGDDWPDDIRYFCELLITAPGEMVYLPKLRFELHRVNSYPTLVADAVQHNAWWDAQALRQAIKEIDRSRFRGGH